MPDSLLMREGARTSCGTSSLRAPVELIGRSATIGRVREQMQRAAALESAVLLVGEAGVEIESVALDLHSRGRPSEAPWVAMTCGTEGSQLASTLFGATAAGSQADLESISSDSLIAQARGGTLFLADVTELPSSIQARLARIARDREVRIEGSPVSTDLRIVAGAAPSIDADVQDHRFRSDLYRRLAPSRIDLPSLRDRPDDVPALAERVLQDIWTANESAPRTLSQAAVALLASLTWPGNLAELRSAIERVVAHTRAGVIQVEHVLPALQLQRAATPFVPAGNLREARIRFERDYIAAVLQHHEWRMAEAAQTLGIQRPNLYRKARQLGIPVARASE
jgi:DNA-binding NtrC family response regulator